MVFEVYSLFMFAGLFHDVFDLVNVVELLALEYEDLAHVVGRLEGFLLDFWVLLFFFNLLSGGELLLECLHPVAFYDEHRVGRVRYGASLDVPEVQALELCGAACDA